MNSNINQINHVWRDVEEHPSQYFSPAHATKPHLNLQTAQGSKVDFVDSRIWSNFSTQHCMNLDLIKCNILSVSYDKKAFPSTMQITLPVNQETQLAINAGNQRCDGPGLNNINESSRSDSSFHFDHSRFNSPEGNNTFIKKDFTNTAIPPDLVANEVELVCGFSDSLNFNYNAGSGVNREAKTKFLGAIQTPKTALPEAKNLTGKARANNLPVNNIVNPFDSSTNQGDILFDFSHLLNATENLDPDDNKKSNLCFPVSNNVQDPMSQFHADFSSSNASFSSQPVILAVDKCWDHNTTLFAQQPKDISISALPQSSCSPLSAFLSNAIATASPQNNNDEIVFPRSKEKVLPINGNSNVGVFRKPLQNKTFIPPGYPDAIPQSKKIKGLERLLKMSKLQQDEKYCIRTMLAKSTIKNEEYQSIFQDLTKVVASQAEAIYKKTQKKLLRAREDVMERYNTTIDKYISEVIALQKKSKEVQAKVYKIRNDEKWKRFEIKC